MPPLRPNPNGQLLIAPPARLQEVVSSLCGIREGVIVLAVPPMICAGCGKPRSLFVNRDGRSVCISDCAVPPSSADGD